MIYYPKLLSIVLLGFTPPPQWNIGGGTCVPHRLLNHWSVTHLRAGPYLGHSVVPARLCLTTAIISIQHLCMPGIATREPPFRVLVNSPGSHSMRLESRFDPRQSPLGSLLYLLSYTGSQRGSTGPSALLACTIGKRVLSLATAGKPQKQIWGCS